MSDGKSIKTNITIKSPIIPSEEENKKEDTTNDTTTEETNN